MSDKTLILLGKIIKVHGYGGAVILRPDDYITHELQEMEWVFIEIDKKPVPFFITSVKEHTSGNIVLKFDNYDSSERMKEFIGCNVFTGQEGTDDKNKLPHYLILAGYSIYNQANEYIGTVKKVMSMPMQYMLVLEGDENDELLIPMNEEWLIELDKENETIIMDLPDGIVQINK
mgnify:CR=1 FL=1